MTSPKFRLGNRRPYGYLRSPTLLRLRRCVRGVSIGLEAHALAYTSKYGTNHHEEGRPGFEEVAWEGSQQGRCQAGQPDIHIYVKEGFSSRCHVFFKRPSKKRSVSIVTSRTSRGPRRVPPKTGQSFFGYVFLFACNC